MKIAVNIGPTGDWSAMLAAAQVAESCGFDALGFLDHYHADQPEWSFISSRGCLIFKLIMTTY